VAQYTGPPEGIQQKEKEVRKTALISHEENLKTLRALEEEVNAVPPAPEDEATQRHLRDLEKLRDWGGGEDTAWVANIQQKIDTIRQQWLKKKHGGKTVTQTQAKFEIPQDAWDKATGGGGWVLPPVLPNSPTLGVLTEVQENGQKGGAEKGQYIMVFDGETEEYGVFHAPLYLWIEYNADKDNYRQLWIMTQVANNLGIGGSFDQLMQARNTPCLVVWETNDYNGAIRVKDALPVGTEGL